MTTTIRLTDAQRSALECAGLETPDGQAETVLASAWTGAALVVTGDTRNQLFEAVNDLSNGEDAFALASTGDTARFARRASLALSHLALKVLKA